MTNTDPPGLQSNIIIIVDNIARQCLEQVSH